LLQHARNLSNGVFAMLFGNLGLYSSNYLIGHTPNGILPNRVIYHVFNPIVNARSLPFIILLIAVSH
jgi:D-methionine transport system permease protein